MWKIGAFKLDPHAFELSKGGEPVAIQRRPLDLLLCLLVNRERVVSREELLEEVWGGVSVSDGALATAIYELRSALEDHERAADERYIVTVRGKGFRFRGPVQRQESTRAIEEGVPYIGREKLVDDLRKAMKAARAGEGSFHLIEGAAGMGKSRLVHELTHAAKGIAIRGAWCEPGAPPYWVWMQLWRQLSNEADGDEFGRELHWVLPSDDLGDAESFQFERAQEMFALLERASQRSPIAIVCEDLHWADAPSVALLESISMRIRQLPVIVLATARHDGAHASARLGRAPTVRRVELEPLSATDVYRLVEAIHGQVPTPDVVGWLGERSGGVPLYVRELASRLDRVDLVPERMSAIGEGLFAERIEALPEPARRALAIASLCGERFDLLLVENAAVAVLSDDREWIEQSIQRHLLEPDPSHPLRFRFTHALIREAAAQQLEPNETARWHQKIGEALERRHPRPGPYVLSALARHFAAAALVEKDAERPFHYSLLAARAAAEHFLWPDVELHSKHMLGWIENLEPGPERDAAEVEAALLRCASISGLIDHVRETEELLARVEPLIEPGDASNEALALGFRCAVARQRPDVEAGLAHADRIEREHEMPDVAAAWRCVFDTLAGRFSAHTRPLPLRDPRAPASLRFGARCGWDPWVDHLCFSAFACWATGQDEEAVARCDRAISWAENRGDTRSQIWALFVALLLHELRRDWNALVPLADRIDPLSEAHQIRPWLGSGAGIGLWARLQRGELPDFTSEPIGTITRDRARAPNTCLRSAMLLLACRAFEFAGKHDEAMASCDEVFRYAQATGEKFLLPEILRQRARLTGKAGDEAEAREAWARAIEVARDQQAVVPELRALHDRVQAGAELRGDRDRLAALREEYESGLGDHERALLRACLD